MIKIPFFSSLLGGKQNLPTGVKDAIILNGVNAAANRTDDDVAWKEQQGTNYELLHDDPLEEVLNEMMYDRAVVFDKTKNDYVVVKRAKINLNMVGLRLASSHVNRTSFNDKQDVEMLKCDLRAMTKLVKMQSPPDTFSLGMSTFLMGAEYYDTIGLNDSVDGKKAKLLKTIPRVNTVEVSTGELPKGKGAK